MLNTMSSTTDGQIQTTIIAWTVPNFMELINDKTEKELRLESKDSTSKETDPRFQLKMLFRGTNNDIIEIYFLSSKSVFLRYKLYVYVRNTYGHFYEGDVTKEIGYHIVNAQKWQFSHMIRKDNINSHVVETNVRLRFEFIVTCNIKVECNICDIQLNNDYENLLNSGMFSDVIMKSAEGVEYNVHKLILASRSKVLKAHFEHNTTECISNIVESPLESEVLQELITFIYTDTAPGIDKVPEKLLAAADYYQLSRLKRLCEESLHEKLTVENAIEFLQLAELYSATDLKQWTLEYIKDGQAILITETKGWAELDSNKLIKMIYKFIMHDVDENGLYSPKKYIVSELETDS